MPLKKGSESTSALQKVVPLSKAMPKPQFKVLVGVDWHNCLEVHGQVGFANQQALQRLVHNDIGIVILSYIGQNSNVRRDLFYQEVLNLPMVSKFHKVADCKHKCGRGGKVALYKDWGVSTLFDDNKEICQEGFGRGIQVFPITTKWESHQWFFEEGFRPYHTFAIAAKAFLDSLGK